LTLDDDAARNDRNGYRAHTGCWDNSQRRHATRLAGTGSRWCDERVLFKAKTKNIHLASGTDIWDIAAETDTGCRQEQGAAPTTHGLEAAGNSDQSGTSSEENQPLECRRQLVVCICSSCCLDPRQHHPRHLTPLTRNSERDYCYDKSQLGHTARLYLLDRTGLGRCGFGVLCSLPRRSGQGFPGIWVVGVGLLVMRVGGSGLLWMGQSVGHPTACQPLIPPSCTGMSS
jgi:hypothetical protein